MTDLTELISYDVSAIKATEEYQEYKRLRDSISLDEHLYSRTKELMQRNCELHEQETSELFSKMDSLTNEFEDVINNELACDFMEAEVTLCRLVQKLSYKVLEGLELD